MQVAERGEKRTRDGIKWAVALVLFGAVWAFMGLFVWWAWIGFVLTTLVFGVKAYAAFTGVKRFGQPAA